MQCHTYLVCKYWMIVKKIKNCWKKLFDLATECCNRYVTKALDKDILYPRFKEFTEFVVEEASIACNPISSLHALKQPEGSSEKIQKNLKASALVTSISTPNVKHLRSRRVTKSPNSTIQMLKLHGKWSATYAS